MKRAEAVCQNADLKDEFKNIFDSDFLHCG